MVSSMVERATSDMLIGPDWAMNTEICDMLNRDPGQAKGIVKGLKKRIGSKNSKVQLLALTLLETIVKNCGDIVHMHVAEKEVPHVMAKIVKKKPDSHNKEKILILIDTWQEAFGGPRARYQQYYAAYQELLRAGAVFPPRTERPASFAHPISSFPPNLHDSDNREDTTEASSEAEYPTLSLSEIQNARGIMDVLAEMLNAMDPANKEGVGQEVIVDLVEQCRTYKQRVVHLVNSTLDESLLCKGLALNDDLQKLLARHEAMASGTPIPLENSKPESSKALIDVDAPLVDTGESSTQADSRSITVGTLPTPPAKNSTATTIDLLGGDFLSGGDALALVPVSAPQPSSPVASDQNALALIDMFSANGNPTPVPSTSQPAGQAYPSTQENNVQPQPTPYANGVAANMESPQYQQSGYPPATSAAWSAQVSQQQPVSPTAVYGAQNGGTLPPPPWESQSTESSEPYSPQYSPSMQNPSIASLQSPTFEGSMHPFAPQPTGNGQVTGMYAPHMAGGHMPAVNGQVTGMYAPHIMTGGHMPVNGQSMTNQMSGMYPSAYSGGQMVGMVPQQGTSNPQMASMYLPQMYGGQMSNYGYNYAQPNGQQLDQRMYGLNLRDDNSLKSSSSQTSMASYLPPMKQQNKGDDKLFGDLVDISKLKPQKSAPL